MALRGSMTKGSVVWMHDESQNVFAQQAFAPMVQSRADAFAFGIEEIG